MRIDLDSEYMNDSDMKVDGFILIDDEIEYSVEIRKSE